MKTVFGIFHLLGGINNETKSLPVRDSKRNESMMEFEQYGDAENYIRDTLLPRFKSAHYQIQKVYKMEDNSLTL